MTPRRLAVLLALAAVACSSASTLSPSDDGGAPDAEAARDAASPGDASSGSDASGAASDGSVSDASRDGGLGPLADGGLFVQFVAGDRTTNFDFAQQEMTTGTVTFGAPSGSASDNNVALLTRTGGQTATGTAGAEEIVSKRSFSFGTFRFRLSLAACASSEEVVNGPFAYHNDGTLAPDGLVVNREVDIEILCGEPWLINLTIWTEYTDDQHVKNQSRVVDTRTGTVSVFANDRAGNMTGTESHPELAIPGFPQAGAFYELGWTWAPNHLRYFLVSNGVELTLWDATDATRIPQLPMEQHFNIWAPGNHWSTGTNAAAPAHDATLTLDWFRYDPM